MQQRPLPPLTGCRPPDVMFLVNIDALSTAATIRMMQEVTVHPAILCQLLHGTPPARTLQIWLRKDGDLRSVVADVAGSIGGALTAIELVH